MYGAFFKVFFCYFFQKISLCPCWKIIIQTCTNYNDYNNEINVLSQLPVPSTLFIFWNPNKVKSCKIRRLCSIMSLLFLKVKSSKFLKCFFLIIRLKESWREARQPSSSNISSPGKNQKAPIRLRLEEFMHQEASLSGQ